jgi:uncharacterized protein HemX
VSPNWQATVGLVSAIGAVVVPWLVYRNTRRQQTVDQPQKIIDQIQEEREADRRAMAEERAHVNQRQARLERRQEDDAVQIRVLWDYVLQLRYFIATGQEGPPPTLPEMIRVRAGDRAD